MNGENGDAKKPIGVKLVSIYHYLISAGLLLVAGISLIAGLVFLFNPSSIGAPEVPNNPFYYDFNTAFSAILFGVVILAIVFLNIFTAWGVWNGWKWSRISSLIFSLIFILMSFIGIYFVGWPYIIISIIIFMAFTYMLFSETAKQSFFKSL
jgi:hypothetical protein